MAKDAGKDWECWSWELWSTAEAWGGWGGLGEPREFQRLRGEKGAGKSWCDSGWSRDLEGKEAGGAEEAEEDWG